MPSPLPFAEVTRRLKAIGYDLVQGTDGLLVYTKTVSQFFPYGGPRRIAYYIPATYADLPVLPGAIVEDIVLHLFLTSDEDEQFWNTEEQKPH